MSTAEVSIYELLTSDPRWKLVKSYATRFVNRLKAKGFRCNVFQYPGIKMAVVDFYDPELRSKLSEIAEVVERNGTYGRIQTKGSLSFELVEEYQVLVRGDIPVSMLRPEKTEIGFWREVISENKTANITEIHLHMWDHKPGVHVHIEGLNPDPVKLADFVSKIRDISKRFLASG